jgi:hypothetical protein
VGPDKNDRHAGNDRSREASETCRWLTPPQIDRKDQSVGDHEENDQTLEHAMTSLGGLETEPSREEEQEET